MLVLRGAGDSLEVLCLRRGSHGRSPGSWEAVHGHIDPGETPVATARRELLELLEEGGVRAERWYNLSRVESFYRHSSNEVVLIPVFAAFLAPSDTIRLSAEHDALEWLTPSLARERMSWPRVRREIDDAVALLGSGGAGALEDVLGIPD